MGAPVLEAWAAALRALALARAGDPEARPAAMGARRLASAGGVEGAGLFADAALAVSDSAGRSEHLAVVEARRAATGIAARWAPVEPLRPAVEIRLFGGLRVEVDGVPLDLGFLKPRARTLLRLLAAQGGRPLHREVIQAALWPDATSESAARNLHVAISSLRQALEPGVARAGFTLLVRDGDAYCLASGSELRIDLVAFECDVGAGRRARTAGDAARAMACLEAALDRWTGDLLPEDGAADWAVEQRERCRSLAAEAAEWLAQLRRGGGDPAGGARAAARGLRVERYHDPLWRLLVAARDEAGDPVAASRARADYRRVLSELDLPLGSG
jgi:DNA-binding SARP family transcriptional activator